MRSLETLMQQYPDKTSHEILEIQKQDKIKDEKEFKRLNKTKMKWINDINTNGGFFKTCISINERYYYKVSNANLTHTGIINVDVEEIIIFLGSKHGIVNKGNVFIETDCKTYIDASNYSFEYFDRITEKNWTDLEQYIRGVEKIW